jgi:precorrin-2 dehydrogenase/sirohydrochlorin ferrochelatase
MKYYPLFLDMKGRKAVVFGGGTVAYRKIKDLLKRGARVEVSSKHFSRAILRLSKRNFNLRLKPKDSVNSLLKEAQLAFIATSDHEFNQHMVRQCREKKVLVNVADEPKACDFIVPSFLKKGKLEVAVSTSGASPLLARKFREELSRKVRVESIRFLDQMAKLRLKVRKKIVSQKERKKFLEAAVGPHFTFFHHGEKSK